MGTNKRPARRAPTPPPRTSIADALFTKGQQRVLGLLFVNAMRSFYANEIIALTGAGTGAVQRELARLESAGIVTATRIGKQKHYQANADSPVFALLRAIVLRTSGMADLLRDALARRAADIRAAFVYGSVAKNEDAATSDIDLLIVSDTLEYSDLFGLLTLAEHQIGRKVNPQIFTRAELAKKRQSKNAFVTRVLEQPKIWLIGGEDDL
jgi:predicted nucleotidyltransferase